MASLGTESRSSAQAVNLGTALIMLGDLPPEWQSLSSGIGQVEQDLLSDPDCGDGGVGVAPSIARVAAYQRGLDREISPFSAGLSGGAVLHILAVFEPADLEQATACLRRSYEEEVLRLANRGGDGRTSFSPLALADVGGEAFGYRIQRALGSGEVGFLTDVIVVRRGATFSIIFYDAVDLSSVSIMPILPIIPIDPELARRLAMTVDQRLAMALKGP